MNQHKLEKLSWFLFSTPSVKRHRKQGRQIPQITFSSLLLLFLLDHKIPLNPLLSTLTGRPASTPIHLHRFRLILPHSPLPL